MTLKAQVREGRLVLDEPTDLSEGTEVELTPVVEDDLGPEERQALDASLARSAAQLARDELVDAHDILRRLRRGLGGEGAGRPAQAAAPRPAIRVGLSGPPGGPEAACTLADDLDQGFAGAAARSWAARFLEKVSGSWR